MSKIKIAYLIDTITCDTAGTEKQLLGIIERLDRKCFEPSLICLWKSPWMECNKLPCKVFTLGYKGFIKSNFPKIMKRFITTLHKEQFDIVQTFFEDSIFVGLLGKILSRKKSILLSSRRDIGLGNSRPWYHALYRTILPVANRGFNGLIVNGENVKEFVMGKEKVSDEKIKVIHNGVNIPLSLEPEPALFKEVQSDFWIGIVANLSPVKRIDVLLHALSELKGVDFHAVIIGDGSEKESLLRLSEDLGLVSRVHFIGAVKNVVAYLQGLDVGVLCSDREGFSNSVLEYMACSLPVVATSVGGNIELVDDSNGFCVPSGDYEALAKALRELALNPDLRKAMGKQSLEKVKENYSWERSIRELEEYYKELLAHYTN